MPTFKLGSVVADLELRKKQWDDSLKKAGKDMNSLRGYALRNQESLRNMGNVAGVAGLAIAAGMGFAIKKTIEFNREIAAVATLMPGMRNEVLQLKEDVRSLAVSYGKDTLDLANGAYQVVSAFGAQAAQSRKLEIATIAAAAGMSTTTESINLLSAVTKGYGDVSDEAFQKASDLSFMTVKMGQTTFPELAASIGKVVPMASALGVKQEELFAGFATLTGVTGSAAEVSTQLSGILGALMKPTTGMTAAIKKLGFNSAEAMLKEMGLVESLRAMIQNTDGTSVALGKLSRRKEALTAVLALTGGQAKAFDQKLTDMGSSANSSNEALGEMTNGVNAVGFSFQQTQQRMAVLVQQVGELLLPAFNDLLNTIDPIIFVFKAIVTGIREMGQPTQLVLGLITSVTAGGLLLFAAFTKISKSLAEMPPRMSKIAGALGKVGGAFAVVTAIIGGMKMAIDAYAKSQDKQMAALAQNALKEKVIFDELMAYRKGKRGEDLEDYKKSIAFRESLIGASRETQLKLQRQFLMTQSANYRNFVEQRNKVETQTAAQRAAQIAQNLKTIDEITTAAREKATQGTIEEFAFRKEMVNRDFELNKQKLIDAEATNSHIAVLARAHSMELKQIEKEKAEFIAQQEEQRLARILELNNEFNEQQKEARTELDLFFAEQDEIARVAALEGQELERARLQMWYEEQKKMLMAHLALRMLSREQFTQQRIAIEKKFSDEREKLEDASQKKWIERLNQRIQLWGGHLQSMFSTLSSFLDNQRKKLDIEHERERKRIEESTMSAEEKEAALEELEEKYTEKKRSLMRKQAFMDKAVNIASAVMNTAAAITKALPNIPLAAFVGALGAAQIAVIASQPVPLAEGGLVKSEGLALLHPNEVVTPIEKVNEIFSPTTNNNSIANTTNSSPQILIDMSNMQVNTLDVDSFMDEFLPRLMEALSEATDNEIFLINEKSVVRRI